MIKFNIPPYVGSELTYIQQALETNQKTSGDGPFTRKCQTFLEKKFDAKNILLTTSATAALEMAMLLCDLKANDEVIMPSFNFVSAADVVTICQAIPVFVDIRKDTMNIDEEKIEAAITAKTKAIVVVHYGGVACEMTKIMQVAKKYNLKVIEDAAHGINAFFKGKALGTIGDIGCYSFHETKNISMGEGGAILVNNPDLIEKALITWEKGTDRQKYLRKEIDKYSWIAKGSSFLPSDVLAACLWAQLEKIDLITKDRLKSWNLYYRLLSPLKIKKLIELPIVTADCQINAHIFYIICNNYQEKEALKQFLDGHKIIAASHYVPLHSSQAGLKYGRFVGNDVYTTVYSNRILRLPLYWGLQANDIREVVKQIYAFYNQKNEDYKI